MAGSPGQGAVSLTMAGDADLIRVLRKLPDAPLRRVLRSTFTKAARLVTKAAKAQIKQMGIRASGTLGRSLGHRVYTTRGGVVGVVIGPRRKHARRVSVVKRKRGKKTSLKAGRSRGSVKELSGGVLQSVVRNPTRYAHLIERGFTVGDVHVAARPFMRRAFSSSKGTVRAKISEGLRVGIEREVKKLAIKRLHAAQRRGLQV